MLWSIAPRGQGVKGWFSKDDPRTCGRLRAGGGRGSSAEEKLTRFLHALYDLHIAAIRQMASHRGAGSASGAFSVANKAARYCAPISSNDLVEGDVARFRNGTATFVRPGWLVQSVARHLHIFHASGIKSVMLFARRDLAWELSSGRVRVGSRTVALFDSAVSATLEYLV
jgi:hypothetical protein